MPPQAVREAVHDQRVHPRIGRDDLEAVSRRWVAVENAADVFFELSEHDGRMRFFPCTEGARPREGPVTEHASRDTDKPMSLLQVAQSVLAAFFGVQSNRNRERDFKGGSAKVFVIAGLIGTVIFIVLVATVVRLVLGAATG
jgi:hypothetical protein